jgi:hypothetical protein
MFLGQDITGDHFCGAPEIPEIRPRLARLSANPFAEAPEPSIWWRSLSEVVGDDDGDLAMRVRQIGGLEVVRIATVHAECWRERDPTEVAPKWGGAWAS